MDSAKPTDECQTLSNEAQKEQPLVDELHGSKEPRGAGWSDGEPLHIEKDEAADDGEPKKCCSVMHLFILNYCFLLLFYMSQNVYNIGVIRTLERKFGLSSTQSGLIMSSNDVSHILVVVFVGYFGKKAHKPRFLSLSLLLVAVAALLMASPKFFFAESPSAAPDLSPNQATTTDGVHRVPIYGSNSSKTTPEVVLCGEGEADTCDAQDIERDSTNQAAYITFLAAQFLAGLGGSAITTLGFSYIDENSQKHESALRLGIVTSVFALGPVAGFGMASLCLRLPESLGSDSDIGPGDVSWIGCWWLGYVINSVCITACCIPMWFFPKHIVKPQKSAEQVEKDGQSVTQQLKEFPREILSLLKNSVYMVYVLMSLLMMYVLSGLFVNMPRYIEVHFFQPAYKSSFVAVTGAVAGIVGSFCGGYFMKRRKVQPSGAARIMLASSVVVTVGIVAAMCLGCPQLDMAGDWQGDGQLSVVTPCNENCTCSVSRDAYKPACGQDGLTYFSACHAGCTVSANGTYQDCRCIQNAYNPEAPGSAVPGPCPVECNLLIPYVAVFFIIGFFGNAARTPSTILQFRIVGDEQRAFALGFTSFVLNLLAFIPAPVLFGSLIDSACILWQNTCSASGTGSCLLYNSKSFRLITHGIALLFKVLGTICTLVICILVSKMTFTDDESTKKVYSNEKGTLDEKTTLSSTADDVEDAV